MNQEHCIIIHIEENVGRAIEVDGQMVYQDDITAPYTDTDPIGHLETFLLNNTGTLAPHPSLDSFRFIPEYKFPEKYYWRMPLWKNREKVAKKTFLGWCMRVIEQAYLATRIRPHILELFPVSKNPDLPGTPDDLVDMRIILPCQPLDVRVQEALHSYIGLCRLKAHQWSTRLSDSEIPDGYIAVLEYYHGGKLESRQGLCSQSGGFGRIDIVSQKLE